MAQRHSIRRLDLRLRSEFPLLRSEIRELSPNEHVIHVPRDQIDVAVFAEKFRNEYVLMGDRVTLSNEHPMSGHRIEPISDHGIGADQHAVAITRSDIETVLSGMFPELPEIVSTRDGSDGRYLLTTIAPVPEGTQSAIRRFMDVEMPGRPIGFRVGSHSPDRSGTGDDRADAILQAIRGLEIKPIAARRHLPDFVRDEEHWWFENVDGLFTGRISPRSLPFGVRRDDETSCYLHATLGPQLDVRQALMTYDVLYMELPLEGSPKGMNLPSLWDTQAVTKADLLTAVETDRIRLVRTQAEERSDLGLMREAREANPNGVVGRRMSAALMIADAAETAHGYVFGKSEHAREMETLVERLAEESGRPAHEIASDVLFPQQLLRGCLRPLQDRGLMGLDTIGQGRALGKAMERVHGEGTAVGVGMFGTAVHVAHMLDATLVPPLPDQHSDGGWLQPLRHMGDRLNFHRSANDRIAAAWATNERRREAREILLPPVPLFDFSDRHGNSVPFKDVLELTASGSDRRKGRALMTRLSLLPVDERQREIDAIRSELAALAERERALAPFLVADAGLGVAAYAAELSMIPFLPAFTLLRHMLRLAKKRPALDGLVDEIERTFGSMMGRNEDLTFMSRIDRIATFQAV